MKLLVLAHTPPPKHGQSVMVELLLKGLPARGITVFHVNVRLSRDSTDVGRWRIGKVFSTARAAAQAILCGIRNRCDVLYYVPAPPRKRGALYRDWLLLGLCRPFFGRLVLHWHAVGLGTWLREHGSGIERSLSSAFLGRADTSIVLADALRADAEGFSSRRIVVVPNGVPDPGPPPPVPAASPFQVSFLGQCSEDKGLFAAARAVVEINQQRESHGEPADVVLTAAGPFADEATATQWATLAALHPAWLRHIGSVDENRRRELFAQTHVLCFPTHYAAEGFPLVALEALAADRPVIATAWRGLPEIVTPEVGRLVPPFDHAALVAALKDLRERPPSPGACRERFLMHYSIEQHLERIAGALQNRG